MNYSDDLLSAEQLESLKMEPQFQEIDASKLISDYVEDHVHLLKKKKQTIDTVAPRSLLIRADKVQLREVVDNLVSNASKYSEEGSRLCITCETVGDKEVAIHVDDEGQGFKSHDFERMFGKFQRLPALPTGSEGSNGLGLFIVKHVADLHGSTVRAENRPTGGARMSFIWPEMVKG